MINRQKLHIKNWMLKAIKDDSWKNYNDLHIDEIDLNCEESNTWLSCGIKCLEKAIEIRDSLNLPFVVALGIEIKSSSNSQGINCNTLSELNSKLGGSPPALYLFLPNWNNWIEMLDRSIEIKDKLFGIENTKCHYYEHFDIDNMEYRRSIFLWSPA